jgi:hypothetical protein
MGYPKTDIEIEGDVMRANCNVIARPGRVREIYPLRRDRGMIHFPSFLIDVPVDHGCSGGPVVWDDRLCGIVSSGTIDDCTIAATLWPFCLLEYEYPDHGPLLGGQRSIGELLDAGTVRAAAWEEIKRRINKRTDDDDGRSYAFYDPQPNG